MRCASPPCRAHLCCHGARRSQSQATRAQVLGSNQSMWAIGDASTVFSPKALDYADELFEQADDDNSNDLSLKQLQV